MVLRHQAHKPVEQVSTLVLGKIIDPLDVVADREDTLPPSHRVRAHNRMDGQQLIAHILRCTAGTGVYGEFVLVSNRVEKWLCVGCCEAVEEGLVGLGDSVVDFVARGPECVYFC